MEIDLLILLPAVLTVGLVAAGVAFRRSRRRELGKAPEAEAPQSALPGQMAETAQAPRPVAVAKTDLASRLGRTRAALSGSLKSLLGGLQGSGGEAIWEQLEEVLLTADVGLGTARHLLERVKTRTNGGGAEEIRAALHAEALSLFEETSTPFAWEGKPLPLVISIVGVNGVGKTTTTGKISQLLRSQGRKVLLGAVDTFRAGAIAQLRIWAERTGSDFVTGREGADPGAVAFDAVTAGKARGMDVVLLDTAGRLHTKIDLMEELKKVHRVVKKVIPEAPHETWLVIDGTLGQNSIQQAKEFQKALELTGIIVTKLDGTAKGGAVLAVASELKLPVRYIGVGESAEDFLVFEPKRYVGAILGEN